jgi:hypothetical protein
MRKVVHMLKNREQTKSIKSFYWSLEETYVVGALHTVYGIYIYLSVWAICVDKHWRSGIHKCQPASSLTCSTFFISSDSLPSQYIKGTVSSDYMGLEVVWLSRFTLWDFLYYSSFNFISPLKFFSNLFWTFTNFLFLLDGVQCWHQLLCISSVCLLIAAVVAPDKIGRQVV